MALATRIRRNSKEWKYAKASAKDIFAYNFIWAEERGKATPVQAIDERYWKWDFAFLQKDGDYYKLYVGNCWFKFSI